MILKENGNHSKRAEGPRRASPLLEEVADGFAVQRPGIPHQLSTTPGLPHVSTVTLRFML